MTLSGVVTVQSERDGSHDVTTPRGSRRSWVSTARSRATSGNARPPSGIDVSVNRAADRSSVLACGCHTRATEAPARDTVANASAITAALLGSAEDADSSLHSG